MKAKYILPLALLSAALLFLIGCGGGKPTLYIYNWADYMDPDLVAEFEEQNNCRIVLDTFDTNEAMYAKLKAGATGYDLIFPTSYMAKLLWEEGLIQELDKRQIPNVSHVDANYLQTKAMDPAMVYSVPYMIGTTGIAYRSDRVESEVEGWEVFEDAQFAGRMTLMNDMRETLGAALIYLGYSANTTDIAEIEAAGAVVKRWMANIAKFENEQYKSGIASSEFFVVHGYSGDLLQVIEEDEAIVYVLPKEGFMIGCDDMVIPSNAPNAELAHTFINFLHDPEIAARNTEWVYFLAPNSSAYPLLSEEVRSDPAVFVPEDLMSKAEIIRDLGEDNALYIQVWDQLKAGQ
jgi:spermidine/putrescine transport system substrate-binding protein